MNQGGFEANIRLLAPGRQTVVVDGAERPLPQWPADVNGIRFGALERRGRWLVTRLEFADQDVILGDVAQTLTLRHVTTDRTSFMPACCLPCATWPGCPRRWA